MPSSRELISRARRVLLTLPCDGPASFEDLIGHIFQEVFGRRFQISGAGTQFGADGGTIDDASPFSYEAKLYDARSLDERQLRGTIAQRLENRASPCSLWALATTVRAKLQIHRALRLDLARGGARLLVLDWTPGPNLPRLFTLLVAQRASVLAWFSYHAPAHHAELKAILEADRWIGPHRAVFDALALELAASRWESAAIARPFAELARQVGVELALKEASAICVGAIEFADQLELKRFNQIPVEALALRQLLGVGAEHFTAVKEDVEETDAVLLIRAIDFHVDQIIASDNGLVEDTQIREFAVQLRRRCKNVGTELGASVMGADGQRALHMLVTSNPLDEHHIDELRQIACKLSLYQNAIQDFELEETLRRELRSTSFRLDLSLRTCPLDLAALSRLLNQLDLVLERCSRDLADPGERILARCRIFLGRLIDRRLLPDLTTFRFRDWAHEFIMLDRVLEGGIRQTFAMSRYPISPRNLAFNDAAEADDNAADLDEVRDDPHEFTAETLSELLIEIETASERIGYEIGLPAVCHDKSLRSSFSYLPKEVAGSDPLMVLTDQILRQPSCARFYFVPWFVSNEPGKPHDFDFYA